MSNIKKDCMSCLYCGTHEKCDAKPEENQLDCLGSRKDQEDNNGDYLYKNYMFSDEFGIWDRVHEFEKSGKRNIVIGGQGEAEVNVNRTPEETLENLCHVAECCGYMITRGEWQDHHKEIHVYNHGHYILTYWNNKLDNIEQVLQKRVWSN
jgi:hypothetical protein